VGFLGQSLLVLIQFYHRIIGGLEERIDSGQGQRYRLNKLPGQNCFAGRQQPFLDETCPLLGKIIGQALLLGTHLTVGVFLPDARDLFDILHDLIGVEVERMIVELDDVRILGVVLERQQQLDAVVAHQSHDLAELGDVGQVFLVKHFNLAVAGFHADQTQSPGYDHGNTPCQ